MLRLASKQLNYNQMDKVSDIFYTAGNLASHENEMKIMKFMKIKQFKK